MHKSVTCLPFSIRTHNVEWTYSAIVNFCPPQPFRSCTPHNNAWELVGSLPVVN
jgi:hypothetical protein